MKGYELLTSLYSEIEAQIIKEKLADAGIECFVQHSDSIGISATLDSIKGIKIFVQPYDLEKSLWLITDSKDDLTDDMEIGAAD